MSTINTIRGAEISVTPYPSPIGPSEGLVGIDVGYPNEGEVMTNLTPAEAVRLSRALVKAAAEALKVSIRERSATLPDGPL